MIYITGDKHRNFTNVADFCRKNRTNKNDILIIVGDAGINYFGQKEDCKLKGELEQLPITLFCIHGNHEERPFNILDYRLVEFHGGKVYREDQFPSLLFAKDGEIYDFDGVKTIVMGGAYSVDKFYRIAVGFMWFKDEQPSEIIKREVEDSLNNAGWKIDCVLSHTAPIKYEPVEWFIRGLEQDTVDKTTEKWLQKIESRLDYKKWYLGHYHGSKTVDKVQILYNEIIPFAI